MDISINVNKSKSTNASKNIKVEGAKRSFFKKNQFRFALDFFRDVAQPGSAHVWGAWGRKFESCHPDKAKDQNPLKPSKIKVLLVFYPISYQNNTKKIKTLVSYSVSN